MRAHELLIGLEALSDTSKVWCLRRPENYDLFLDLYKQVGYAPADPPAFVGWQGRSIKAWSEIDQSIYSGTCAGGIDSGGRVVSGMGTIPISPLIAYGHSVCMVRTLAAAASLYLPALYSLEWIDRIPGIEYWAGSYTTRSGFTGRFQRSGVVIPNQIEIDVIRYLPGPDDEALQRKISLTNSTDIDLSMLSGRDSQVFALLSQAHPSLRTVHSIRTAVARDEDNDPFAMLLIPEALAEITASNVFSWVWAFPAKNSDPTSIDSLLRHVDVLRDKAIQVIFPPLSKPEAADSSRAIPSFWGFTPRQSMDALRRSVTGAFEHVIAKYSEPEIDRFALQVGL